MECYLEVLKDLVYTRSSCSDFEIKKGIGKVIYEMFRLLCVKFLYFIFVT